MQGGLGYLRVRNVESWLVGWSGLRVRLGMCESVGKRVCVCGGWGWVSMVLDGAIRGEGGGAGCLKKLDGGG